MFGFDEMNLPKLKANVDQLFAPVWTLDLPDETVEVLIGLGYYLVIQLCRVPSVRRSSSEMIFRVRKELKKRGLDFGMQKKLFSDWLPRDLLGSSDEAEGKVASAIDGEVNYYLSIEKKEQQLPSPKQSPVPPSLRQRVEDDSRFGMTFSRMGRILLSAPLAWDAEEYAIPDGVMVIASNSFLNQTTLKKVVIPNSVIRIESSAFAGCSSLTEIEISDRDLEIEADAFDQVPGRKNLPPPLLARLKKGKREESADRRRPSRSPFPLNKKLIPFGVKHLLEQWQSWRISQYIIPDVVPPKTELDRRLNSLMAAPVREADLSSACCYSPLPYVNPLVEMLNELRFRRKLFYRCPDCGKVSVFIVNTYESCQNTLIYVRELREIAGRCREIGLDVRVEEPPLCPYCNGHDIPDLEGDFIWHVRRDGREFCIDLEGDEVGPVNEFLSAETEEDYMDMFKENGFSHTRKFEIVLKLLGFLHETGRGAAE